MGVPLPSALSHGVGHVPRSESRRMTRFTLMLVAFAWSAVPAFAQATAKPPVDPHAGHVMPPTPSSNMSADPATPIPPLTAQDRAAAFPQDLHGHAVHDRAVNYFVLFDQLEWQL